MMAFRTKDWQAHAMDELGVLASDTKCRFESKSIRPRLFLNDGAIHQRILPQDVGLAS